MSWIPNLITLARLLMVPVVAILLANNLYTAAFWLFLGVGLSDGLDGFIARRFNATSATGALLDPVADKMVIVTCAFALAWNTLLPLWLAVPLIVRDVLMLSVGLTDPRLKEGWLPPNLMGKAHAALAFATLTLVIAEAAALFDLGPLLKGLFALLFVTVLVSAALYFRAWWRSRHAGQSGTPTA
jgi:cardiolipin synthase